MVAIIDYKAGNAPCVLRAARHLGFEARLAKNTADLADASRIVLPGVGRAYATMESLRELGLTEVLQDCVLNKKIPFLGICVGLQVLFEHSEEDDTPCLGWLKGCVTRFNETKVRVPQMGWNRVSFVKDAGCAPDYFYFVNSYHAVPADPADIWATAAYGGVDFTAAVKRDNIYATQFHVEKSGEAGLGLFKRFLL